MEGRLIGDMAGRGKHMVMPAWMTKQQGGVVQAPVIGQKVENGGEKVGSLLTSHGVEPIPLI